MKQLATQCPMAYGAEYAQLATEYWHRMCISGYPCPVTKHMYLSVQTWLLIPNVQFYRMCMFSYPISDIYNVTEFTQLTTQSTMAQNVHNWCHRMCTTGNPCPVLKHVPCADLATQCPILQNVHVWLPNTMSQNGLFQKNFALPHRGGWISRLFLVKYSPGFPGFSNKNPNFHIDFHKKITPALKIRTSLFSHSGFP